MDSLDYVIGAKDLRVIILRIVHNGDQRETLISTIIQQGPSIYLKVHTFGSIRRVITLGLTLNKNYIGIDMVKGFPSQPKMSTKILCPIQRFQELSAVHVIDGPFLLGFRNNKNDLVIHSLENLEYFNEPLYIPLQSYFQPSSFDHIQLLETRHLSLGNHRLLCLHFVVGPSASTSQRITRGKYGHIWLALDIESLHHYHSIHCKSRISSDVHMDVSGTASETDWFSTLNSPVEEDGEGLWKMPVTAVSSSGEGVVLDVLAQAPFVNEAMSMCTSLGYFEHSLPRNSKQDRATGGVRSRWMIYWGDEVGYMHMSDDDGLRILSKQLYPLQTPLTSSSAISASTSTSTSMAIKNIMILETIQSAAPILVVTMGHSVFLLDGNDFSVLQEFYNVGMLLLLDVKVEHKILLVPISDCRRLNVKEEQLENGTICEASSTGLRLHSVPHQSDKDPDGRTVSSNVHCGDVGSLSSTRTVVGSLFEKIDLGYVICDPRPIPIVRHNDDCRTDSRVVTRLTTRNGIIDAIGPFDLESVTCSRRAKRGSDDTLDMDGGGIAEDTETEVAVVADGDEGEKVKVTKKNRKEKKKGKKRRLTVGNKVENGGVDHALPVVATGALGSAALSIQNALRARLQRAQESYIDLTRKLQQKYRALLVIQGLLLLHSRTTTDVSLDAMSSEWGYEGTRDTRPSPLSDEYVLFPGLQEVHKNMVPWKMAGTQERRTERVPLHSSSTSISNLSSGAPSVMLALLPDIKIELCKYRVQRSLDTVESSSQLIIRVIVRNLSRDCIRGVHLSLTFAFPAHHPSFPLQGKSGVIAILSSGAVACVSATFQLSPRMFVRSCNSSNETLNSGTDEGITILFNLGVHWVVDDSYFDNHDMKRSSNATSKLLSKLYEIYPRCDLFDDNTSQKPRLGHRGLGVCLLRICYNDFLRDSEELQVPQAAVGLVVDDTATACSASRARYTWKMPPFLVGSRFDVCSNLLGQLCNSHSDVIGSTVSDMIGDDLCISEIRQSSFLSCLILAVFPSYLNAISNWNVGKTTATSGLDKRAQPPFASSDVDCVYRAFGCTGLGNMEEGIAVWAKRPKAQVSTPLDDVVDVCCLVDCPRSSAGLVDDSKSADLIKDSLCGEKISDRRISTTTQRLPVQETCHLASGTFKQFTVAYESSRFSVPSILFLDKRILQNGTAELEPSVRIGCLLALDNTSLNAGLDALVRFSSKRDLKVMPIADDCFWIAINKSIDALRRELSLLAMCWKLQRLRTCMHGNTPMESYRRQGLTEFGRSGLFITNTQLICLLQLQCHTDTMISDAIAAFHCFKIIVKSFGFKTFSS